MFFQMYAYNVTGYDKDNNIFEKALNTNLSVLIKFRFLWN